MHAIHPNSNNKLCEFRLPAVGSPFPHRQRVLLDSCPRSARFLMRLLADARSRKEAPRTKGENFMNATINTTRDLLITAIDLTRACCAHENYLTWLSIHRGALAGSAEIAN